MNKIAPQRPGLRVLSIVVLVAALGAATGPADAARPPDGRTYYTLAMGIGGAHRPQAECFEFSASKLCSLDGRICGSWKRDRGRAREIGFTFELAALDDDATPVELEGRGRIDTRGLLSSVAGAGMFRRAETTGNFSFAGREVEPGRCLELLEESPADDDRTVTVGSGILASESREVGRFTGVVLNGIGRVVIRHTGLESLTVTADDNLLPLLRSEVRDGRLLLTADGDFRTDNEILYEITLRELDELTISGVAGVEASGIDTDRFSVDVRGVSIVTVAGRVERQVVRVAGVSIYEARRLESRFAEVDVAGVSKAVVRVSELLTGHLSGTSTLEYLGNPRVDVEVPRGCTLRRID